MFRTTLALFALAIAYAMLAQEMTKYVSAFELRMAAQARHLLVTRR